MAPLSFFGLIFSFGGIVGSLHVMVSVVKFV